MELDFSKYHLKDKYRKVLEHLSDEDKIKTSIKNYSIEELDDICEYYNLRKHPLIKKLGLEKYGKDPESAYYYTGYIIKGRWPEAEPFIKTNPKYASNYAKEVIGYENFWENTFVYDDPLNFIKERVKAKLEQEERERQAKLEQEERERQAEIERQDRITNKHNQLNEFVEKIGHFILQDGSTVNDYVNKIRPNSNEDFVLSKVCEQITEYAIQNYAHAQIKN